MAYELMCLIGKEYLQGAHFSFITICKQDFRNLHHLLNIEPVL